MMPSMMDATFGMENTVGLTLVQKTVDDHELVESSKVKPPLFFQGVLEPLSPQRLLIKPEGQRTWKWWTLLTDLQLQLDDQVKDQMGKLYRVVTLRDWSQAGYYEYEILEGHSV